MQSKEACRLLIGMRESAGFRILIEATEECETDRRIRTAVEIARTTRTARRRGQATTATALS